MKSPTAPQVARCYACKKQFISYKRPIVWCPACHEAITQRWAAEDARLFYTSPLAGYND